MPTPSCAAIEAGRREYDFLGGPARYKTQLALASRPIVRVRAWRPSLVESVHRFVEWGANRSRGWRQKLRGLMREPRQSWPISNGTEEA